MPFILTLIVIIALLVGIYVYNKEHSDTESEPDNNVNTQPTTLNTQPIPQSADRTGEDILKEFLSDNGCKPEIIDTDNGKVYLFKYNGGNFRAVTNDDNELLLNYDAICDAPTKEADRLCRIANDRNNKYKFFKVTTTFDKEKNYAELNISYEVFHITKKEIDFFVNSVPVAANDIRDELRNTTSSEEPLEQTFDAIRMHYLTREADYANQDIIINTNQDKPLSISNIISLLHNAADIVGMRSMTITTKSNVTTLENANDIINFDVIPEIYNTQTDKLSDNAVLQISTETNDYLIVLNALSQDEFTIYFRLVSMLIPHDRTEQDELQTPKPEVKSLLVAYDKQSETNRHAEYQYMLTDAKAKLAEGKEEELTPEQQFILKLQDDNQSEQLYRGKKLFLDKRYYEAIVALQPEFVKMMQQFFNFNKTQKDAFFEVAYMLGFAYTDLQQYDRAFYYLHLINPLGMVSYSSEYINALANASDIRVFNEIDQLIETTCENKKEEDLSDSFKDTLQRFHEFLLRRKGYACINFKDYDTAENIFTQLLDSPYSHDYAEHELTYIKKIKQQQSTLNSQQ